MEGFIFQQSWRLKASKSADEKHFIKYFYGPLWIRYKKFLLGFSLDIDLEKYLLFYFISQKINRFTLQLTGLCMLRLFAERNFWIGCR